MQEPSSSSSTSREVMVAWAVWAFFFVVIAVIVLSGSDRTVTPVYRHAAASWLRGAPLYSHTGNGFIYLPQASLIFAPIAALPPLLGEVIWRLVTIATFAWGVWCLARLGGRDSGAELFPLMTCLCVPLASDAARNGQATLLVAAMMMLAVAALADRRWWRATLWLVLGLAIKPMIAWLCVLAAVLYRPTRAKLLVGLVILFALPFVFQQFRYVIGQYVAWFRMLGVAGHLGANREWAHLFGLLGAAGVEVPVAFQNGVRAVAAVATLVLCGIAQRRYSPAQAAVSLFVLQACGLMLLSPRTENNTYAALAPALAVCCAQAWMVERRWGAAAAVAILAAGVVGNYEISRHLAPAHPPVWCAPLMCVGFTAYVVAQLLRPGNVPVTDGHDAVVGRPEPV